MSSCCCLLSNVLPCMPWSCSSIQRRRAVLLCWVCSVTSEMTSKTKVKSTNFVACGAAWTSWSRFGDPMLACMTVLCSLVEVGHVCWNTSLTGISPRSPVHCQDLQLIKRNVTFLQNGFQNSDDQRSASLVLHRPVHAGARSDGWGVHIDYRTHRRRRLDGILITWPTHRSCLCITVQYHSILSV